MLYIDSNVMIVRGEVFVNIGLFAVYFCIVFVLLYF